MQVQVSDIQILLYKLPFFIDMLGDRNMNIETSIISIGCIYIYVYLYIYICISLIFYYYYIYYILIKSLIMIILFKSR